ncbi:phage tail fiber domain-containing protein, partial [Acinetobacter colistiniresistens]|uniref:phage tail fiber domain-containing protein n=1 Tax=Acinetobacter colistiniresistens TaxID=280145 RepID=UPI00224B81FD
MAVPKQTPYVEYVANGATKVFPLEFDVLEQDHLIVLVNDIEPNSGSWLFDVANSTVIFSLPPANGTSIKIRRDSPMERSGDYKNYNTSFRPAAVNNDFDNIWKKLQEMGVLNWIIGNNIKDLNAYVNSLNDETRNAFLE